jgi:hypothetical protein
MEKNPSQNDRRDDRSGERRTVIPTPRSNGMFAGWGIRL